jgi:hypothetical protein
MLLEEKHIYQSVVIDAKSLISAWASNVRAVPLGILIDESECDNEQPDYSVIDELVGKSFQDQNGVYIVARIAPSSICRTASGRYSS